MIIKSLRIGKCNINAKVLLMLLMCFILTFTLFACNKDDAKPDQNKPDVEAPVVDPLTKDLRLIVPDGWELEIGDSRSVDCAFKETLINQNLTWTTDNSAIATVDKWGRVTGLASGTVKVTATNSDGISDTISLNVVTTSTKSAVNTTKVNYAGTAVTLGSNLQKIVTRYAIADVAASTSVPQTVKDAVASGVYTALQTVTTPDGAVWQITDYGVLRTDNNAADDRDKLQRFMGDRYFYGRDTGIKDTGLKDENNKTIYARLVLAILSDGDKGIWTIMEEGITHIQLVKLTGEEKAVMMVEDTQEYVMRHGYVAESYYTGNGDKADGDNWKGNESDNDGLWTSMYAAGELMRYASLKADPSTTAAELAAARSSAWISTEAVLLLSNLSMRTGTTEAYIRYQPNGRGDDNKYGNNSANGRFLSCDALEEGGNAALQVTNLSPAEAFQAAYDTYIQTGEYTYLLAEDNLSPYDEESWSDPRLNEDGSITYETRTRNLEGFIARTYSFDNEGNLVDGFIHWDMQDNGTAVGVSTKTPDDAGYYINGQDQRGVVVTANGDFPTKLWNDLKAAGAIGNETIAEMTYKGDTSADEIIGHLFLYKLAYDIIGAEDAELKAIISNTMERFAQHVSDNSYMLIDGSGQPGTWGKYCRSFFYNSSQMGGSPLTSAVALCIFKVAYYVTGNQKWQNEYLMAALDPSYEYAKLMTQCSEQYYLYMLMILDDEVGEGTGRAMRKQLPFGSEKAELLTRYFLNYSDEEMAMLAFYLLFQLETDEMLLNYYRAAIDDWWVSIKYSENPLWYYIYQLSRPGETVKDAYGNNILETAAWSLSRHVVDTTLYLASNSNRDDVAMLTAGQGMGGHILSYKIVDGTVYSFANNATGLISSIGKPYEWAVAAPDERALHKYNGESYRLGTETSWSDYNPNCKEGSTTYTLPFWMGIYHGMLKDIE